MNKLNNFIENPTDPLVNFELGYQYDIEGQTAAAFSHYLRSAEYSEDKKLQYESLIRGAACFEKQDRRTNSVRVLYQRCISLLPKRPEAYYLLSRLYEWNKQYQESYMIASQALEICDFFGEPLRTPVDYPGRYAIMFEKGVSAWWIGNWNESRHIMSHLKHNYRMNEKISAAVHRNIQNSGSAHFSIPYEKYMQDELRFKFFNYKIVGKNFSQVYQDMFVLSAHNGKMNGSYLEIGSADPFKNSNTALLEQLGWKGLSFDIDLDKVTEFNKVRKNKAVCRDALRIDYVKELKELGITDIDYLQVDCDPPAVTFEILKKIPFDKYRFATITFEHDYYVDQSVREASRQFLQSKGYKLLVSDIGISPDQPFEDWWVHPELIPEHIQKHLIDVSDRTKWAKDYMLPRNIFANI